MWGEWTKCDSKTVVAQSTEVKENQVPLWASIAVECRSSLHSTQRPADIKYYKFWARQPAESSLYKESNATASSSSARNSPIRMDIAPTRA